MANVRKSRYGRFLSEIWTISAKSVCSSVKAGCGRKMVVGRGERRRKGGRGKEERGGEEGGGREGGRGIEEEQEEEEERKTRNDEGCIEGELIRKSI